MNSCVSQCWTLRPVTREELKLHTGQWGWQFILSILLFYYKKKTNKKKTIGLYGRYQTLSKVTTYKYSSSAALKWRFHI